MAIETHLGIERALCGEPLEVGDGRATVRLVATLPMAADARGLVHGGFVFGAADYAAMLAVNDPNVVLGSAEARFLAPVCVGDAVTLRAQTTDSAGRKRTVTVKGTVGDRDVFAGTFTAFVLDAHVLDR